MVGEAWRDVLSGTTRAGVFAVVFVALVGGLASVDVRSVVSLLAGADHFRVSGAAVQVLNADGSVDGARCDGLSSTAGVGAAGAVRQGTPIRFFAMPASQISVMEVTPGLAPMLGVIGQPSASDPAIPDGIWLSADLAQVLGASPGRTVATSAGPALVAGVYTWPDDGRGRDLGYAVVAPVPAQGSFSQCWTQIWPTNQEAQTLAFVAVTSDSTDLQITQGQLNTTLGLTYDTATLLATRLTGAAPWAAAVIGLVLGFTAVHLRRLEIASSLHARVTRTSLLWQHLCEAVFWIGAGVVISGAGLAWAAGWGNPDPAWSTWIIGARVLVAGAAATALGTMVGVLAVRETHLFRYTKAR